MIKLLKLILITYPLFCANASFSDSVKLAVTTSFNNSGLSDVLLPKIESDIGLNIKLLVVGTGQAMRLGAAGDVDAIIVHSPITEEHFVANGYGSHRREIMYNDYVIIGPRWDPANVRSSESVQEAFGSINRTSATFISRGDDSGTHKMELMLWKSSNFNPDDFGEWYKSVGSGMGASLNIGASLGAYILTDRASWLNFKNKSDLEILFQGDKLLFNQYSFIPINPIRHKHVKYKWTKKLENWLTSKTAEIMINNYKIGGQALFQFNANYK